MSKPVAYVINLERRPDRWAKMQERWTPFFDLVRIPAVDMPGNGQAGCRLSHRMIAAHFLEKGEPVLIMEDDNAPVADITYMPGMILEAKHYVGSWDYLNLSPWLDLTSIKLPRASLSETVSPLFLKSSYSHNTNMVLYNRRSLALLNDAMRSPLPLDMFLGNYAKDQWVPITLLARQDDSPGDIPKPAVNSTELYRLTEEMLSEAVKNENHYQG